MYFLPISITFSNNSKFKIRKLQYININIKSQITLRCRNWYFSNISFAKASWKAVHSSVTLTNVMFSSETQYGFGPNPNPTLLTYPNNIDLDLDPLKSKSKFKFMSSKQTSNTFLKKVNVTHSKCVKSKLKRKGWYAFSFSYPLSIVIINTTVEVAVFLKHFWLLQIILPIL